MCGRLWESFFLCGQYCFFSFSFFLCGQLWVLFFCVWSVVGVVFLCVWPAAGVVLLLCVVGCGSHFFSVVSIVFFSFSFFLWSVVGVVFLCVVSCGCCFSVCVASCRCCFTLVCGRLWELFFLCGQCSW